VAEVEAPPVVSDIETEAFPKLPGAGFDLGGFPEPPPLKCARRCCGPAPTAS
jgi:hypothetical protein